MRASGINVPPLVAPDDLGQWVSEFVQRYAGPNRFAPSQQQVVEDCKIHQGQLFGPITGPLEAAFKSYEVNKWSPKELLKDIRTRFSAQKPVFADAALGRIPRRESVLVRSDYSATAIGTKLCSLR